MQVGKGRWWRYGMLACRLGRGDAGAGGAERVWEDDADPGGDESRLAGQRGRAFVRSRCWLAVAGGGCAAGGGGAAGAAPAGGVYRAGVRPDGADAASAFVGERGGR